jgi:hypothetical protein
VRNGSDNGYYRTNQTRYVSVRNIDRHESPRYVAVRRQRPVYVDSGVRYVAVRRAEPRVRYVPISEFEDDGYDDEIRYVKTRRHYDSGTRYVAVRGGDAYYEAPRTRYVAVRSNINTGCSRPVALRSCLGDVETTSVRRVVVRNDVYANRTNYVAVRDNLAYADDEDFDPSDGDSDVTVSGEIDDDAEYFVQPTRSANRVKYVDSGYADDVDSDGAVYLMSNQTGNPCVRQVAVRNCPETIRSRTISYAPVSYYDDEIEQQAYLDGGEAAYVAVGRIEDACLSTVGARRSPAIASTRSVSYVPADDVDDYAFLSGSDAEYFETDSAAPAVRYVAVDEGRDYVVEADEVEYIEPETVSYVPVGNRVGGTAVRYISADDAEYVDVDRAGYMPAAGSYDVEATYIAADDCPELVGSVVAEPVYVSEASTVLVEDGDPELVAGLRGTQTIAGSYGFRDGFEDGREAALERDEFHPENSGDFRKATEGYEDEYGDKDVYKAAYRNTYLQGYAEGFESAAALA